MKICNFKGPKDKVQSHLVCVFFPSHQSKVLRLGADRLDAHIVAKELVSGGCCHVKGQHPEENMLHVDQLLLGVCVVCDVHKLIQIRREDLLIFSTRQHQKVQLSFILASYCQSSNRCNYKRQILTMTNEVLDKSV